MKGLRSLVFPAILAAALIAASCYQPLTELLIAAIEDDYSPVIVVDSPISGDTYYSTIDVTGYIIDDSLATGDNKGLLRSISFIASNDLAHKGRINIDSNGTYENDLAFGNEDIDYIASDRSYSFTVTTSDLGFPPQTLYVLISAVDFNGNESSEVIQLIRNEGPYVILAQPIDTYYVEEASIYIGGSVADSFQRQDSAVEVASIRLDILALGISIEVDTTGGNVSEPLFPRDGTLDYEFSVGAAGQFQCTVDLLSSDAGITNLTINVVATDLNGNTSTASHSMTQIQEAGPVLSFSLPYSSGTYYYSGDSGASPLLFVNGSTRTKMPSLNGTGMVYSLAYDGRRVANTTLRLSSSPYDNTVNIKTHPNTTYYDPLIYGRDYYRYDITFDGSLFHGFDGRGTAELTLWAEDDTADARESTNTWQIREDSAGPVITPNSIATNSGSSYVGITHTIDISFNAADGSFETGLDPTTLSGSVAGIAIGAFSDDGGGDYSVSVNLAGATQSSGSLDIAITAEDYIGNTTTINEGVFDPIEFLTGVPSLTAISIAADVLPSNAAAEGDGITLTITSDQDLDPATLSVTIAGEDAVISGTGNTLLAKADIPLTGYSTSPVGFSINGFSNMVGTPGTGTPITGVTDGSSVNLYTTGPELTTVSISTTPDGDEYAASGETIILTITSDQLLSGAPTVVIGGRAASESGSGTAWTATATNPNNGINPVTILISNIENVAGIGSSNVNATTDSSGVLYYPGTPELENVNMTLVKEGVNAESYPEDGDTIHLEFDVVGDRDLMTDPTVSLTSITDSGPPEVTTTVYLSSTADSGPAPYVYDHVLDAADVALVDALDLIVNYIDMANNVGQQIELDIYDLTP